MVAVRKAMWTEFCATVLDHCHLFLKFLGCPRVACSCVVFLRNIFGLNVLIKQTTCNLWYVPGNATQSFFHLRDGTLKLTVDEGVLLIEGEIHFIFKVAAPSFRCNTPDIFVGGHHLRRDL